MAAIQTVKPLPLPNVGEDFRSQSAYILRKRRQVIQPNASRFSRNPPNKDAGPELLPDLEQFLMYLDNCVQMTPRLKKATLIDKGLDLILNEKYKYPTYYVEFAQRVKQKWEDENWGADTVEGESDEEEEGPDAGPAGVTGPAGATGATGAGGATSLSRATIDTETGPIVPPPSNHPIYGIHGIMHGLAVGRNRKGGRKYIRNLIYKPRSAMVFGDNGLTVGQWWPIQLAALFHGAHGSSQGGISGNVREGAYSIVLSARYDDLDHDAGDHVRYSGSRAHHNTNPLRTADESSYTRALRTSLTTHRPVRLLRASSGKSHYAPSVGIRYDGLYRIVRSRQAHNTHGGLYDQFELERCPGQEPLEEVIARSPTAQQRADFARIGDAY